MSKTSLYLESLIKKLSRLPGVGPKSASRMAFHLLKIPREDAEALAAAILAARDHIHTCRICGGIADSDTCGICSDQGRDRGVICVLEEAKDVLTIEATGMFRGLYHVTKGLISPLDGIGPEQLNLNGLVDRCREDGVREAILALNPSVEGEATSLYIARILHPLGVRVTRIARGLPVGADIEYADSATIVKSLEGRVDL